MNTLMTSSLAALALLAAPAFAQDASTGGTMADPSAGTDPAAQGAEQMAAGQMAGGDPQIRQGAIQSAQGVGVADAAEVAGAFVLQGTSPTGAPIMMVVGPAGELLALATPFMLAAPGGEAGGAAGGVTDVAPTSAETGSEPQAGEAADEGFMATQTQPASPGMWDPAQVDGAMQSMGGGGTTTTTGGETTTAPAATPAP